MVENHPSGFLALAAAPRQPLAATTWPTSPLKTRVRGSRRRSSGRFSRRGHGRSMFTPGLRGCAYKTASGRYEWPNRDPIQERGKINLYEYVGNNPESRIDSLGLTDAVSTPRPKCPKAQDIEFIQVVTSDGSPSFGLLTVPHALPLVDNGNFGYGNNILYPHDDDGSGFFEDQPTPSGLSFETCRVCRCQGKMALVGPCVGWHSGDDGDLDSGFPKSAHTSATFYNTVNQKFPGALPPPLQGDFPQPNAG